MKKIGLIAGNGRFPFLVAEEIRKSGDEVVAIGLKEETDPRLAETAGAVTWVSLGQFQKIIDTLRAAGATVAIMAGQVKHTQLFAGLRLDWRAIKLLGKLANKKTDTILGAVADEFAREGIQLLPSHLYLKDLLPAKGVLCGDKPTKDEAADITFGLTIAKQIAGLDIGQTVAVKDRAVLAVESIEGTDECIRRAAKFGGRDIVVVKVAKPNQDWRFDIPVVGPKTIEVLTESAARILAIEAGATLLIDKDALFESARKSGLTVVAV